MAMGITNIAGRVKRAAGDLVGHDGRKAELNRDRLYDEARRLGIRGRSRMSDEELAREVSARK
jgi:hypothetical protein